MSLSAKKGALTRFLNRLTELIEEGGRLMEASRRDDSDEDDAPNEAPSIAILGRTERELVETAGLVKKAIDECETFSRSVELNEQQQGVLDDRLEQAGSKTADGDLMAAQLRVAMSLMKSQTRRSSTHSSEAGDDPPEGEGQDHNDGESQYGDTVSQVEGQEGPKEEPADTPESKETKETRTGTTVSGVMASQSVVASGKDGTIVVHIDDVRSRLPPIEIPKFSGQMWQWDDFWTLFESNVDSKAITDLEKMHHLVNALTGEARETVKRFRMTSDNYVLAVAKLKERYSNDTAIVDELYSRVEKAKASGTKAKDQRVLLEQLQSLIDQMENRGENSFGSHFVRQLLSKFDDKIQRQVFKKHTQAGLGTKWEVSWVFDTIDDILSVDVEIERMMFKDKQNDQGPNVKKAAKGFRAGSGCYFCGGQHRAADCPTVTSANERENALKEQKRCLNCLQSGHFVSTCPSSLKCQKCQKKHNTLICRSHQQMGDNKQSAKTVAGTRPPDVTGAKPENKGQAQSQKKPFIPANQGHIQPQRQPFIPANQGVAQVVAAVNGDSGESRADPLSEGNTAVSLGSANKPRKKPAVVLVGSARVWNPNALRLQKVPVLLDTGSNISFIEKDFANEIGALVIEERLMKVNTFGGTEASMAKEVVSVTLFDEHDEAHRFSLFTREALTTPLTQPELTEDDWRFIEDKAINLSLPPTNPTVTRRILIGMDQMSQILSTDFTLPTGLQLLSTKLGFVIGGQQNVNPYGKENVSLEFGETLVNECTTMMVSTSETNEVEFKEALIKETQDRVNDEVMNAPETAEFLGSEKEEKAMTNQKVWQEFEETIERRDDGYYVRFPWKEPNPDIPSNIQIARKRLDCVLKSLREKPEILEMYHQTFVDQLEKGIIEEVFHDGEDEVHHYLAHQPVLTPQKDTTKLRVVFDASAHLKGRPSLNDTIHQGPTVIPDLPILLLRFRLNEIALLADVEKAFLQVRLQERERNACRFLWVEDCTRPATGDNLRIFRFQRVAFGINASPFLLAATIRHHLNVTTVLSDAVREEIKENLYVDNLIMTANDTEEALEKYAQSKEFFRELNMNLREFMTNDTETWEEIPRVDLATSSSPKVLGILWHSSSDTICFQMKFTEVETLTKRIVSSQLHSIFDPMGWYIPLLHEGRLFLQSLLKSDSRWDTPLTDEQVSFWRNFVERTKRHYYGFPRQIGNRYDSVRLAVFSDASGVAMASCIYLLNGEAVHLLKGKAALQPRATIPKMELHALLMALEEALYLVKGLKDNITIEGMYTFCDNSSCLAWLQKSNESKQGVFVTNRLKKIRSTVREIEALGVPVKFGYVRSEENPADYGTRGPDRAMETNYHGHMWWKGPEFLKDKGEVWSEKCIPLHDEAENEDGFSALVVQAEADTEKSSELIDFPNLRMNSNIECSTKLYRLEKAVRVTALVLRFIKKLTERSSVPALKSIHDRFVDSDTKTTSMLMSRKEQEAALATLMRFHQDKHLVETGRLKSMKNLNLQEDKFGVLRCYGRFTNAPYDWHTKTPILVDRNTEMAKALILDAHEKTHHSGVGQTMAEVRSRFWIPQLRQAVRSILTKCVKCQKANNLPYRYPDMTALPKAVVTKSRPFEHIGLDYFGPLKLQGEGVKGGWETAFGCIMTCLTTRMVHLELVKDGTTVAFLNAMRRFFSRRGVPTTVISDNAPTFVLGADILKEVIRKWDSDPSVERAFCNRMIEWRHITPYAPWQGGFYERLVGTVKIALNKTLSRKKVDFETMTTILAEVEAIVNSRPMTYQEERFGDEPILRPIDLLQRDMLFTIPPVETEGEDVDYLPGVEMAALQTRTQALEALASSSMLTNNFWYIWREQYITALREKHVVRMNNKRGSVLIPRLGALVLIVEKLLPRNCWKMGRIISMPEGQIREATVRTSNGKVITRPVNLLVPMELDGTEYYDSPPMKVGEYIATGVNEITLEGLTHDLVISDETNELIMADETPRYQWRARTKKNYYEEEDDEADQGDSMAVNATETARPWYTQSLPNLSMREWNYYTLLLISMIMCLSSASASELTSSKGAEGALRCTKDGVTLSYTQVTAMKLCSEWFCRSWDDPGNGSERVKFPAEILLHDHMVNWKYSDGDKVSVIETICKSGSFCSSIDCTLCTAAIFNPECNPMWSIGAVGFLIYLLMMGCYGFLYVPVVMGRPFRGFMTLGGLVLSLILKGIRSIMRLIVRKFRRNPREQALDRQLRDLLLAAAIMIPCVTGFCQEVDIFSHQNTRCSFTEKGQECLIETTEILKLNPYQTEACLRMTTNGTLLKQIHIKLKSVSLECEQETLFFTRDCRTEVQSSKRCPRTGSCTSDKCTVITEDTMLPELPEANKFPGRTACVESCGGPGCDCFFPSSGCLFYRTFARPMSHDVYRLFTCSRWRESVVLMISTDETKQTLTLVPAVPSKGKIMSATLSSLTIPPIALLRTPFLTDGNSVALWKESRFPPVRCDTRENATDLTCTVQDDCECHAAETTMMCRCSYVGLGEKLMDVENHLPLTSPAIEVRADAQTVTAFVNGMATTEIVIHLKDRVQVTEITEKDICTIPDAHIVGCYNCQKGGAVELQCFSERGNAHAQVDCGEAAFTVGCSKNGLKTTVKVPADRAQVRLHCQVSCGSTTTSFEVAGILKFTSTLEESLRKLRASESTSLWDIDLPDFGHILEVYLTWYKTVALVLLLVGVAVAVTVMGLWRQSMSVLIVLTTTGLLIPVRTFLWILLYFRGRFLRFFRGVGPFPAKSEEKRL